MSIYGQQVRDLRTAAGISQKSLALRSGMTQANLCECERGQRDMTLPEFLRAQAALHEIVAERDAAWQEALKAVAS